MTTSLDAEKLIRELLVSKFLGDRYNYYDLTRPLHVATTYSCYGHLSTLIIEVQGSPPRGLMVVRFHDYTHDPEYCFVESWNRWNRCLRRINLKPEIVEAIKNFIFERGIPYFKEEGKIND